MSAWLGEERHEAPGSNRSVGEQGHRERRARAYGHGFGDAQHGYRRRSIRCRPITELAKLVAAPRPHSAVREER